MSGIIIPFITGPTACGKTAVAVEAAKEIGAEIVSMDSMKVYRGMDILSAKPESEERQGIAYHLMDMVDASESFSTARYIETATKVVDEILAHGGRPLFEGGTSLYLRALTEGLFQGPEADWDIRNRLKAEVEEKGTDALHKRLASVDPKAAERIHANDLRRIIRALEVYEITNQPITELQEKFTVPALKHDCKIFVLSMERELLNRRIRHRVDRMVEAGLIEEVKQLHESGVSREASQALGYKEFEDYLAGSESLDDAIEKVKSETIRFARKQVTFLKSFKDAVWLDITENAGSGEITGRIIEMLS